MPPALIQLLQRAYREIRPRAPMPEFDAHYYHFAGINNTIRLREGLIVVRFSDLLEGAPNPVLAAVCHILLAKLYRKAVDRHAALTYRRHVNSHGMAARANLVRQIRGRKTLHGASGHHFDLEIIFEDLNRRYFHGLLGRPHLSWSRMPSRQNLGHYDPAHNTIVVSRIFDRPDVPPFAVEYLLFHEMLHLKHPVRVRGSRRCVHSREFAAEERLFPDLARAKDFLKML